MNTVRDHIVFWIAIIILLTAVFGNLFESYILSFYFVSMLLPVAVGTSYFFNYWLVPRYLLRRRYGWFFLYLSYLLVVSTWLELWVITGAFVLLADFNYALLNPLVTDIFLLAIIIYFIVFLKAFLLLIHRTRTAQRTAKQLATERSRLLKGYLTVTADRKQARIDYDEILYLESVGDYVRIVTASGEPVLTRERISHLSDDLPDIFLRIHRSIVVNSRKVDLFSKTEVQIGEHSLPVSRTYKGEVTRRLSAGSVPSPS